MMKEHSGWKTILGTLLLLGFVSNSWAGGMGTVELVPDSPTTGLFKWEIVTFNVFMDFEAEGGTLGGGFDVVFDPNILYFVGFTRADLGDPAFGRDPDISPGLLESWAVGDFDGIGSGLVGNMQFQVLNTENASTVVELTPTAGIAGPWVGGGTFPIPLFTPDYLPGGGLTLTFSAEPRPATTYQYDGVVTYCLPAVCDNFAALKVGSVVTGRIDIATSPETYFDSDSVGAFSYTVTNPDLPITPSVPAPADTVANPLYVYYVDELNNNAMDLNTMGATDSNNLFIADPILYSMIRVNGSALQGIIFQDMGGGRGCFNDDTYNYCSEDISAMMWEGVYSLAPLPDEIFSNGFESN